MSRKSIVALLVLVAVLAIGAVAAFFLLGPAIQNVYEDVSGSAGEAFLGALQTQDYQGAYDLFSTDLKAEIDNQGGVQWLQQTFPPEIIISGWNGETNTITTDSDETGVALSGSISFENNPNVSYQLIILHEGGRSVVAGFEFAPTE